MFEAIDAAEHTIDFLTFVYWTGEVGDELGRRAWRTRAADGVRVRGAARRMGRAHDGQGAARDGWRTPACSSPLVPAAAPVAAGPVEPPHPSQGPHHRRSGRIHGRGGDRRQLAGRRPQRDRVARHPLPHRGSRRRRAAGRVPRQLGRDRQRHVRRGRRPLPRSTPARPVGRPVHPRGIGDRLERRGHLVPALLQLACQRIRVTTAYFVPDDDLTERLWPPPNAGSGIDILLPGPHADKRFVQLAGEREYAALLERGVRLWNFQPSMLHAKVMTVDGCVANIGSANLNMRSVSLDEEINVVVLDDGIHHEAGRAVRRGSRAQRPHRTRPLGAAVEHAARGRGRGPSDPAALLRVPRIVRGGAGVPTRRCPCSLRRPGPPEGARRRRPRRRRPA